MLSLEPLSANIAPSCSFHFKHTKQLDWNPKILSYSSASPLCILGSQPSLRCYPWEIMRWNASFNLCVWRGLSLKLIIWLCGQGLCCAVLSCSWWVRSRLDQLDRGQWFVTVGAGRPLFPQPRWVLLILRRKAGRTTSELEMAGLLGSLRSGWLTSVEEKLDL